jgi:hypothetical protein
MSDRRVFIYAIGNFPQAFSRITLIRAARAISEGRAGTNRARR